MSRETLQGLNINTLIDNTDARGHAWHYRAEDQGEQSNHYPGPIPIEDVRGRLFCWTAQSRTFAVEIPATVETMTHLDGEGGPVYWAVVPDRQAITRSDTNAVMGIFAPGYTMHQYDQRLLTTVPNVLDDDLSISSAGLLRGGAIAWVELSVPESITTPQGVEFRPNLLATTSLDGSTATTFKRTVTDVVSDNTRDQALSETGQQYRVKHSRHSVARLGEAREALNVIHTLADEFAAEIAQMCATPVTPVQWSQFLNLTVPRTDPQGQPLTGRSLTMADTKRDTLSKLYAYDPRVAPWTGTAYGVLQAVNTFEHHEGIVRGSTKAERNMLRTINGDFAALDRGSWDTLATVLA